MWSINILLIFLWILNFLDFISHFYSVEISNCAYSAEPQSLLYDNLNRLFDTQDVLSFYYHSYNSNNSKYFYYLELGTYTSRYLIIKYCKICFYLNFLSMSFDDHVDMLWLFHISYIDIPHGFTCLSSTLFCIKMETEFTNK